MLGFFAEGDWARDVGLPIVIVLAVAGVVSLVLHRVVRLFERRLEDAPDIRGASNLQRATTLANALSATVSVGVWTIAFLVVCGYLNVNLAPLIASAGIAGVALGFGAQSIVRDGLSGFFILLENQFGVSDTVEVRTTADPVLGRVEWFTLRATALRAYDGTLHIVPNGNIQVVSNRSRGWARAIVDTRIAYGQDPEQVRELLEELFEEIRADASLQDWVRDGPTVLGVETTSDTGVVIRAVAETKPSKRPDVERLLRAKITQRLAERGIRSPGPLPPSAVTNPPSA